jgi:hypothetical protein
MAFWNVSTDETMKGASGEVDGMREEDPMCMQRTVSVSSHARYTGSQWRDLSWIEGSPSGTGFSGNVMA